MKNIIPAIAVLFCAATLLNSCATGKNAVTSLNPAIENTDNHVATCFVQLNDGSIKQFSSLKLVTGLFTTPHLLADDKLVINAKDIKAYQDNKRYAVSAKQLKSKKDGYVSSEALPGFAVKLLSGKLNVYGRKYYNGANSVDEYFLQEGNDGHIIAYSRNVLRDMLKEDTKALEYFNSRSKGSSKSKKLIAAVEMYNNNQLLTKN